MKEKRIRFAPVITSYVSVVAPLRLIDVPLYSKLLNSSMSGRVFRNVTRVLPIRSRIILPSSCYTVRYNSALSHGLQQPPTLGEIHYHLVQSRVAVSYLPEAPESLKASTYIGSLPLLKDEEPGLNDFEPNRKCVR